MPAKFRTLETWATLSAVVSARLREQYTIYAVVENIGDEEGTVVVRLLNAFKTQVLDSRTLTIPAGGSVRVEFTRVAPDTMDKRYDLYYLSYLNMGTGQVDWEHLVTVNYVPWDVKITASIPDRVYLGQVFRVTARVVYYNGESWLPFANAIIRVFKDGKPWRNTYADENGYGSVDMVFDPKYGDAPGVHEVSVDTAPWNESFPNASTSKYVIVEPQPTAPTPPPPTPPPPTPETGVAPAPSTLPVVLGVVTAVCIGELYKRRH